MHAQPLAGGPAIALTDGPAIRPHESADGRWLLHARPDADGLWRIARRDWRSAAPAASERLEVDLHAGDADRWVPAAAGIYFVRRAPGSPPQLSLFDSQDGSTADVLMLAPGFAGTGLELSPDQARLLFSEPSSHESDLRLAVMRE